MFFLSLFLHFVLLRLLVSHGAVMNYREMAFGERPLGDAADRVTTRRTIRHSFPVENTEIILFNRGFVEGYGPATQIGPSPLLTSTFSNLLLKFYSQYHVASRLIRAPSGYPSSSPSFLIVPLNYAVGNAEVERRGSIRHYYMDADILDSIDQKFRYLNYSDLHRKKVENIMLRLTKIAESTMDPNIGQNYMFNGRAELRVSMICFWVPTSFPVRDVVGFFRYVSEVGQNQHLRAKINPNYAHGIIGFNNNEHLIKQLSIRKEFRFANKDHQAASDGVLQYALEQIPNGCKYSKLLGITSIQSCGIKLPANFNGQPLTRELKRSIAINSYCQAIYPPDTVATCESVRFTCRNQNWERII